MMQYRQFGDRGFPVSTLGFGAMRLPYIGDDRGNIDEEKATAMIRWAIDNGVNYVDTAYVYHDEQSEVFLGRCLQDGYRERIYLATKSPVWKAEKQPDLDKMLDEELERLQTDHIDMYLLHAMNSDRWEHANKLGALEFLTRAKEDGRIRYAGFSFHDTLDVFKTIVDGYDWDFCQIQFNYMDTEYQAGLEGLRYASSRGLAVIIMEPLRGGRLVKNVPDDIQAVWDNSGFDRTPAEWGFRWVANHPEVTVILSGMGTMDEVVENVATLSDARPGALTDEELAVIGKVRSLYEEKLQVNCTACGYCVPCPNEVAIPHVFSMYNDAHMYVPLEVMAQRYFEIVEANDRGASACIECGTCVEACPQGIAIPDKLKELHAVFSEAYEGSAAD